MEHSNGFSIEWAILMCSVNSGDLTKIRSQILHSNVFTGISSASAEIFFLRRRRFISTFDCAFIVFTYVFCDSAEKNQFLLKSG